MEYPLISEYKEAIMAAEDNFNELASLRPVLDSHGEPVMSSGNFAVVFKMRDENDGKLYAVKCFIKDQEGRDESYRKIADELEMVSSSYLLPLRYLENELFVDTDHCQEVEFPVVVMEWVEGETLDTYMNRNLHNTYELEMLSYRFNRMAAWLLAQPFAHGDLKPDNILVRKDGSLVLVDYDGMFVPSMKGEKAREIGSPNYRHPSRTDVDFDEHIDDFPIALIALSLKAIALNPSLKSTLNSSDVLLMEERDFQDSANSKILKDIITSAHEIELFRLLSSFFLALANNSLDMLSFRLFMTNKPTRNNILPNNITYIDTSVAAKDLSEGVKDEYGVIYSKDGLRLLKAPDSLKEYKIRTGTQTICNNAFGECLSLMDIDLPTSILHIGERAFYFCRNLQTMFIPDSIIYIGDFAFEACTSLKQLNIPKSVQQIGKNPFTICTKINITIEKDAAYKNIGGMVIDSNGILISCVNFINTITVPKAVTIIGEAAFMYCDNLLNIVIPKSVIQIKNQAFSDCYNLKQIKLPPSLQHIGQYAFSNCESLRSILLPSSLQSIEDYAFFGCKALMSINLPKSVTIMGNNPFEGCLETNLTLSDKSVFRYINRMLINPQDELISCLNYSKHIDIPNGVVAIKDAAFSNCESLESISIPDTVLSIAEDAFCGCEFLRQIISTKDSVLIQSQRGWI